MASDLPDRIAIDANGFGWRVWDDEDYWSMVPTNPDNSPIPQPVTWFVPAKRAAVEAIAAVVATNGFDRLINELVPAENRNEAMSCLTAIIRVAVENPDG